MKPARARAAGSRRRRRRTGRAGPVAFYTHSQTHINIFARELHYFFSLPFGMLGDFFCALSAVRNHLQTDKKNNNNVTAHTRERVSSICVACIRFGLGLTRRDVVVRCCADMRTCCLVC